MRKSIAIATFAVASTGALGVGAVLTFFGSDTWGDMETELITSHDTQGNAVPGAPFCGPAFPAAVTGLTYAGGGSGKGENQMIAGSQVLAPMSRFLGKNICAGVTGNTINEGDSGVNGGDAAGAPSAASGLVVALDGLSILGSINTAGTLACNGTTGQSCAGESGVGLAWNTTVHRAVNGDYTFQSWQDVLKVLYLGVVDTTFHPAAGEPENGKNCNSEIRNTLANNWGSLFENPSCGASGSPVCTQLQHIFRRDDASGTSDIFGTILGAAINSSFNTNNGAATYGYEPFNYFMGTDSFCNDAQNQFVQNTAGGVTTTTVSFVTPVGNGAPGVAPNTNAFVAGGIIPNDDQDYDPIRRLCPGKGTLVPTNNPTEQVCERATFNEATPATATATVAAGAVTAINLTNGGSGYAVAPAAAPPGCAASDAYSFSVVLEGGGGAGATATACVDAGGHVSSVALTAGGVGYTTAPTVDLAWYQGTLGLMIPVLTTNTLALDATPANAGYNIQYATVSQTVTGNTQTVVNRCKANGGGASLATLPPKVPNPALPTALIFGLCPNGDNGNLNGNCQVPSDAAGNPNCMSLKADGAPAIAACTSQSTPSKTACGTTGPDPRAVDPRVFNLFSYTKDVAGNWTAVLDDSKRPVVGAFYRIHTSQDMLANNAAVTPTGFTTGTIPVCNQANATNQIGCLVQASPCSLGYAGRGGEGVLANFSGAPGATGMRLAATGRGGNAGIPDAPLCIQNQSYPFWRKMYLNSIVGFGAGSAAELALASCENTASIVNQAVDHESFIELPDSGTVINPEGTVENINGGNAFCEDFDEFQICANGGGSPTDAGFAGTNNGCNSVNGTGSLGLAGGPSALKFTACGNGILEPYEDCDLGTSGFTAGGAVATDVDGGARNGSPGSTCSAICRFTK
jgi:hypothetical protein